jgi:hypothetical protein
LRLRRHSCHVSPPPPALFANLVHGDDSARGGHVCRGALGIRFVGHAPAVAVDRLAPGARCCRVEVQRHRPNFWNHAELRAVGHLGAIHSHGRGSDIGGRQPAEFCTGTPTRCRPPTSWRFGQRSSRTRWLKTNGKRSDIGTPRKPWNGFGSTTMRWPRGRMLKRFGSGSPSTRSRKWLSYGASVSWRRTKPSLGSWVAGLKRSSCLRLLTLGAIGQKLGWRAAYTLRVVDVFHMLATGRQE